MTKPTELKTERLLLRPFRLSDIDDVLEYASDAEWAAFRLRPYDRGAAERMVARALLTSWDKEAEFAVVLDGRVIGRFSLTVDHKHQTAELGACPRIRSWRRNPPRNNLLTAIWTLSWSN